MKSFVLGKDKVAISTLYVRDCFAMFDGGPVYQLCGFRGDNLAEARGVEEVVELSTCGVETKVYPVLSVSGIKTRWGAGRSDASEPKTEPGQNEKRDAGKLPVWDNLVTEVWDFWLDSRLTKLPSYLREALNLARRERWTEAADVVLAHSNLCAMPFEYGTKKKYSKGSWQRIENGFWRLKQAAGRHLLAWLRGEEIDPESKISHQAHLEWCIVVAGWYQKKSVELAA